MNMSKYQSVFVCEKLLRENCATAEKFNCLSKKLSFQSICPSPILLTSFTHPFAILLLSVLGFVSDSPSIIILSIITIMMERMRFFYLRLRYRGLSLCSSHCLQYTGTDISAFCIYNYFHYK